MLRVGVVAKPNGRMKLIAERCQPFELIIDKFWMQRFSFLAKLWNVSH